MVGVNNGISSKRYLILPASLRVGITIATEKESGFLFSTIERATINVFCEKKTHYWQE